jgi:hypothetical protein
VTACPAVAVNLGGEARVLTSDGPEPFPGELDQREWDRVNPVPADADVASRLYQLVGMRDPRPGGGYR